MTWNDPQARMNFRKSSCNKYYYLFYKRYTKILFDQMQCAQKYIHNHRVYMYAFFYWCTHDFGHVYVDTYPLFFSLLLYKVFKMFLALIILYCSKIYCYIFNFWFSLSLEETDSILFKFVLKKPYFPVAHKNCLIYFSPYLRALIN